MIKLFYDFQIQRLEQRVNEWLKEIKLERVNEIKFHLSAGEFCVMIIYKAEGTNESS